MIVIFGVQSINYTKKSGDFYCPNCQDYNTYKHKRSRQFYTFFFIPLIPSKLLGEYIECQHCRNKYKLEVLNFIPKTETIELRQVIKQVMISMMIADGTIHEKEIEVIQTFYAELTGINISKESISRQAERRDIDIIKTLTQLTDELNNNEKEAIIKAAFIVTTADGEFQLEEERFFVKIAKSLGMSEAHVKGVVSTLLEQIN